ncbi:MAG: phosphotransferase [Deltaproteobacteria bacterium HGW-Deltaproteobacteria-14]|jgi:hypothetical protein|nr:MAG: phosphotransferase [Deltaproteobacteria bacterium HGW-Deltaproteobacteria-14]
MRPPSPAVQAAVRAAFPSASLDSLAPLAGGLSGTPLYSFAVGDRRYVVRHVDRTRPFDDPVRQFACMTLAAERGVAPAVHHADPDSGVCITDYVAAAPDRAWLRTPDGVARVARLIRRLHDGPPFDPFIAVPHAIGTMLDELAAADAAPAPLLALRAALPDIAATLARHATQAPCHYDLNPGNLLCDGDRVWLVDWELAGAGDPFHDLGTLSVFGLLTPEHRERLLDAYLDRTPTAAERARLHLARLQALVFYAAIFPHQALGRGHRAALPAAAEVPTLAAFYATLRPTAAGSTSPLDPVHMGHVMAYEVARAWADPQTAAALARL